MPDRPGEPRDVDDEPDLPPDPDVDTAGPFAPARRSRWPRIRWAIVAAVAAGGFVGGIVRYLVGLALPTPAGAFPWGTFLVNTVGAFILALLLIVVLEVLPPTTYLRPVVGTGFCGALTTFSSVATGVDQLVAHGHAATAAGYVVISLAAGLAAASFGIVLGRAFAGAREESRD